MEIQVTHTPGDHAHYVKVTLTDGEQSYEGHGTMQTARDAYKLAYRKARAARNWGALDDIMIYPTDPAAREIALMRTRVRGQEHLINRLIAAVRDTADERDELEEERDRLRAGLRERVQKQEVYNRAYDALVAKQHALLSAVALTMRYLEDAGDTESDAYQALAAVTEQSPALGLVPRVPEARSMDATRVIARLEHRIRQRERRIRELEARHPHERAAAHEENRRLRQQLDAALDARKQAEQTLDTIQDMLKAAGIIGHVRNGIAQVLDRAQKADEWKRRYEDLREQGARRELQHDGDSARLAAQTLRAAGYTGDMPAMVKAAIDRAAHYQRLYSKAQVERAQLFEQIKRHYGAAPDTAERKAEAAEPSDTPESSTAPHEAA